MNIKLSWPWAWGIAAVAGAIAAVVAAYVVASAPEPDTSAADVEPGDRLSAAIASLERNPFYVAPELRDSLTDRQRESIAKAVRSADEPFYLAYMTDTTDAGYYQNYNAVEIIADHIGDDGLFAIIDERLQESETSRGIDFPYIDREKLQGRDHTALRSYAKAVADSPTEPKPEPSDYWGGPGGGLAAGGLFGASGFFAVLLLIWIASMFRAPVSGAGPATKRGRT